MTTQLRDQLQAALGPAFRVGDELTGGGMSRIFLVDDLELERRLVAKLLPPELSAEVSVERFRREIQLCARLQHPHIVPLLAAGAREGLLYYTMPFIEGESLRARLTREHQLPVSDAIRILREVADALSYAHQQGVVHRDIKPDNVLFSGHHAVVTDFGVSKAIATSSRGATLTSVGVALGTPSYMSPEQITADTATDHRADLYALGALGYELLTGRPPFVGQTPQQILSAHLTQAPESIRAQRPAVPAEVEQVIMRCLEKVPADRWQTADELLAQLESLATPRLGLPPSAAPRGDRSHRWWFVAGAAVAVAGLGLLAMKMSGGGAALYETGATRQVANTPLLELHPAISPDGNLVAYASGTIGSMRIHLRQIAGGRPTVISADAPGDHRAPQWSADGSQVAFFSEHGLFIVPALGGQPRQVQADVGTGYVKLTQVGSIAALSPDFRMVAFIDDADSLRVAPVAGGASRALAGARDMHSIAWSRDGRKLAYVTNNADYVYSFSSLGNIAPSAIWVTEVDGTPTRVTDEASLNTSPVWTPEGHLLYVSNAAGGRDIYAQRLSRSGKARGAPRRLTTGLNVHTISLSADGTRLAYSDFSRRANIWTAPVQPSGATPASAATPVTDENQLVEGATLSHDGEWLVYDSNRGGRQQLYKLRVSGGEPIQLTNDTTDHFAARWSRDDRRMVYHLWRGGSRDVAVMDADGSNIQVIASSPAHEFYPDLSPDGKRVLIRFQPGAVLTTAIVEQGPRGWSAPRIIRDSSQGGRWAPDGRRFAVTTLDGGLLVGSDSASLRVVVRPSDAPGGNARSVAWSRDGRTVFYTHVGAGGDISYWAISPEGGRPRLVLEFPHSATARPRRVEFDADGSRLFFAVAQDHSDLWLMQLSRP